MKVLVLYHTKTGHTLEAVTAVAEGIRAAGSEVDLVEAKGFDAARLTDYGALIVGSPSWWGSVVGGIAAPIQQALDGLGSDALRGKQCAAISVCSFAGATGTVRAIGAILAAKGCSEFTPGPTARAGVPLSLVKGPSASAQAVERFKSFGTEFVS